MKMESLNQRRQDLEKKEAQLKESVLKFDKFLKVMVKNILKVGSKLVADLVCIC